MVKVFVRTPRDIGALIRSKRRAIGLGQAELAAKIGTSRLWITEIERGKPRASLELVLRTLSALGIELSTDDGGVQEKRVGETVDAVTAELRRRIS